MQCPACNRGLTQKMAGGLAVEVCEGGCGGIWFNTFEFEPTNPEAEAALAALRYVQRDRQTRVKFGQPRICPRCVEARLKRVIFGPGSQANVDECPQCGGCWLDDGELAQLHFEWDQKRADGKADASAASASLLHYLYELRTGHRKD